MSTALTLVKPEQSSSLASVHDTMEALKAIRTFLEGEFRAKLDYGVIPGTDKPTLLLPGAQKAFMYFNVAPQRDVERVEMGGGHLEVIATTRLVSRSTGQIVGEGSGSCSSMEKKYRWRGAGRICPKCNTANIKVSQYGDKGFYCHEKPGGCGAQFRPTDPVITDQAVGRIENPDIHDCRNTILKMAIKRADVSAAMSLACLSERFTQDLEDTYDLGQLATEPTPPPAPEPQPAPRQPTVAERNRQSHEGPRGGPAPRPSEAPTGWGKAVVVPPPAKPAVAPAVPTPPQGDRIPVSGGSLWRWAASIEKERGQGVVHYLLDLGRSLGWPDRMLSWTPQQVADAYAQASDAIELIYSPPDPDDGPVTWDDGRDDIDDPSYDKHNPGY